MCLQGHLCYRGHLSLNILLSINLRLEANWPFCCLIFNASCLVSASALVGGGCPMDMSLGQSSMNIPMSRPGTHRESPQKVTAASSLGSCFLKWCRWVPSQLVSLCYREEGCTLKRPELRDRSSAAGPLLTHCLRLFTSSFNINVLSTCHVPHIVLVYKLKPQCHIKKSILRTQTF